MDQRHLKPACRLAACVAKRGAIVAALVILSCAAVALVAAGCGGEAGGTPASPASGPPTDPGLSPEPVPSGSVAGSAGAAAIDVYLLGGSGARECVVSNADWSAELSALAGTDVRAVDLGATNQSFTADRRYVCNMEEGPKLIVIGVGLGRFTSPPPKQLDCDKKLDPPLQQALDGGLEVEHRYTEARVKSVEKKQGLLDIWLGERYELFRKNLEANLEELEALLDECRERGYATLVLELPINLDVADGRLDKARETYVDDCRRLGSRSGGGWVSFVDELQIPDSSFYDLAHLVEPGRVVWQTRLSEEIAPLLQPIGAAEPQ